MTFLLQTITTLPPLASFDATLAYKEGKEMLNDVILYHLSPQNFIL